MSTPLCLSDTSKQRGCGIYVAIIAIIVVCNVLACDILAGCYFVVRPYTQSELIFLFWFISNSYNSIHDLICTSNHQHHQHLGPVSRPITDELMGEHLTCPTTPGDWKELETELSLTWNVPYNMHVAIRKPPKSGSPYHNYKALDGKVWLAAGKGFFSELPTLALIRATNQPFSGLPLSPSHAG